ncbi:AfsR/SARP family transcriptional regulator [Thalassiella azotivora]
MNADPPAPDPERTWLLQVLGCFRLGRSGHAVLLPAGAARLLAYLAVVGPVSRQQVSGTLWPDVPQSRASADLRTALWRLQRVDRCVVRSSRDDVSLGDVDVDVHRVERWITAVLQDGGHAASGACPAPPPGTGTGLLHEWDDEWLEQPRERLRLLQLHALETLVGRLLLSGRIGEALTHAITLVHAAPLRESSNQLMLELHLRQGNVAEALRHFHRYRRLLAEEIGVEPGPSITALMTRFLPVTPARR